MRETVLDHNPFFGRDMDLMPSEDVFEREILLEKIKVEPDLLGGYAPIVGLPQFNMISTEPTGGGSLVMGFNQMASWANSVVMGTANSVGGYDMSGNKGEDNSFNMNITKKPSWFHRTMVKLMLGWDWVDKEEN